MNKSRIEKIDQKIEISIDESFADFKIVNIYWISN